MSKTRTPNKSSRGTIKKNIGCKFCSNNKMFDNGMTLKCTKCKRTQ